MHVIRYCILRFHSAWPSGKEGSIIAVQLYMNSQIQAEKTPEEYHNDSMKSKLFRMTDCVASCM